jgi:LPXTG-site transpeptidase (sortase) family protein
MLTSKNRRAVTIVGAVILCIGLFIQIAVIRILFASPNIPSDFSQSSDDSRVYLDGSTDVLAAPEQLAIQEPAPLQPVGRPANEIGQDNLIKLPRLLPAENELDSDLGTENLPGNKQNELFVAAIDRVGSEPEETVTSQPKHISLPALGVEAPIKAVGLSLQGEDEGQYLQWAVPNEYAVGWHQTSAPLRTPGNTVLNGHNNVHGAVFENLVNLDVGERLILYDDDRSYEYKVTQRVLFEEDGQSLKERHWNARWMLPTSDERLTIITCWPNTTNSHRLVVVAQPIDEVGS